LDDLNALVAPVVGPALALLTIVCMLLVVSVLVLARRVAGLDRRLAGITRGGDGRSLEGILDAHLDKVYSVARELDDVTARAAVLEGAQRRSFQRSGLVRFNPFEDTGGNQSFALALLDGHGDGIVLSSLHSRAGTRVYGKAVTNGRSESALSNEEAEALRLAIGSEPGGGRGA
jgi:uncharacterized protein DUF4446